MLPLHPATSGHARLARIAVDPAVDQLATPRPRAPQSTPQGSAGHGSLASWRPLRGAYSLRLARALRPTVTTPHRLARIAAIPYGMTSSLRLASAGSRTGPPRPEHGSLAPRQPLRVARLLRLARARAYANDGPHWLARIAVGHPADQLATPRRCR
ncbi:MAG: hypothetical protein EON55_04235 [Alphaproteobacteria bacterium]|nr:MAG: hypothetical protein EON55_04235 [Alphaproteobacteria bacterium]